MSTPVSHFPRAAYVRRTGALCLSMQNQVGNSSRVADAM
jgi:hypothetical protein